VETVCRFTLERGKNIDRILFLGNLGENTPGIFSDDTKMKTAFEDLQHYPSVSISKEPY